MKKIILSLAIIITVSAFQKIYSQELNSFEGKYIGHKKSVYINLSFERSDNNTVKTITGTEHFLEILENNKDKVMTVEYALEEVYSPVSGSSKLKELIKGVTIEGIRYE